MCQVFAIPSSVDDGVDVELTAVLRHIDFRDSPSFLSRATTHSNK